METILEQEVGIREKDIDPKEIYESWIVQKKIRKLRQKLFQFVNKGVCKGGDSPCKTERTIDKFVKEHFPSFFDDYELMKNQMIYYYLKEKIEEGFTPWSSMKNMVDWGCYWGLYLTLGLLGRYQFDKKVNEEGFVYPKWYVKEK